MDPAIRKTGNHAEFESSVWMIAFGLALPICSASDAIVTKGLKIEEDGILAANMDDEERWKLQRGATRLAELAARALLCWLVAHKTTYVHLRYFACLPEGPPHNLPSVDFKVHLDPVSYHLPLHRFYSKIILGCMSQGLSLPFPPEYPGTSEPPGLFAMGLVEHPLRCMVLTCQVLSGLWRRNGSAVHGQALHYVQAPVCKVFRDLDLVALQYGALIGGHDMLLEMMRDRFMLKKNQVEELLGGQAFEKKHIVAFMEEFLLLVIQMVTELPKPSGMYDFLGVSI